MRTRTVLSRVLLLASLCTTFIGCQSPDPTASKSAEREAPEGPAEARKWRRLAWVDEYGRIPKDGLVQARAQMKRLMSSRVLASAAGGDSWQEVGPYNIAGRTRSIVIDPANPNKMWSGSVSGGIWKSTDGGSSWQPVNDNLPSMSISCMAIDPTDGNVIYAGLGEGYFNVDAIEGSGILRSIDGGSTWEHLGEGTLGNVNRLAISPTNPNILLAASRYGGIYRSTDAGQSWSSIKWTQAGTQVLFHPTDGNKAVATVLDYNNGWFNTSYYSTNGGASWTEATGIMNADFYGRIELAYAKSNPNIVYASAGPNGTVYKSTNGGASFTQVSNQNLGGQQWWYDNCIWVDPTNSNTVVVGGVNIFRSTDGGVNFSTISSGYLLTEQPHPDVHSIVGDPGYNGTTNRRVYVCTDGGVHVTDDITSASTSNGWARLTRDARTSQYYGAAGDGVTGNIVGGLQDNGTLLLRNGTGDATMNFGGDGGFSAIDWEDNNYQYGEYVYLLVHRSTNGGASASYITNGLGDAGYSSANFIAPLVMDPNTPQTLYGGGSSLWRTTNARAVSPTWSSIKGSIGVPISAIGVAKGNSNVIWVGHNSGNIYKTTNGTAGSPTWTTIDDNGGSNPLPSRYVTRILVDPSDANVVYVTFGGFSPDNVWVTRNGGSTWTALTGTGWNTLPYAPVRAIARHPNDPNLLHIGTEVGICYSTDGGANWSAPATGPFNVSVDELSYMHNSTKLLAATHGRGLWVLGSTALKTLTVPATLKSDRVADASVAIDSAAPAGGAVVSLTSTQPEVQVPSTVTIPEGSTSVSFKVRTSSVLSTTSATISANYGSSSKQAITQLQPVTLQFTIDKQELVGGSASPVATFTLSGRAPAGGWTATMTSGNTTAVTVPSTVNIPAGQKIVSVSLTTKVVPVTKKSLIKAYLGSIVKWQPVTVHPPAPTILTIQPTSVEGGSTTTVRGTVTLSAPAPAGGVYVTLTSSNPSAASVPASVKVGLSQTKASFVITHSAVLLPKTVTISAKTGVTTKTGTLTVNP